MKKRILTLVVEIDEESSSWIWDSHINANACNGIQVLVIGEGDQICQNCYQDDGGF